MKNVLATIVGLIAASLTIFLVEKIGHSFFPMPDSIDPTDMESIKNNIDQIPKGNMAFVAFAHGDGVFIGMLVASLIAKLSVKPAYIVGGIMIAISVMYYFLIPSPTWFILLDLGCLALGFFLGNHFSKKVIKNATA